VLVARGKKESIAHSGYAKDIGRKRKRNGVPRGLFIPMVESRRG
jgi:hypothetical protein